MPDYVTDGDQGFGGVNMRLDPGQIPPGLAASARNKRFLNAVAHTRPGVVLLPWSNKAEDDYQHKLYAQNSIVRYSGRKADVVTSPLTSSYVATGLLAGDFSSDTPWTEGSGWNVDTTEKEAAVAVAVGGQGSNLSQDIGAADTHEYVVTFQIKEISGTGATIKLFIGDGSSSTRPTFSTVGTHSAVVTSDGGNPDTLHIQCNATFVGKIANVSVSEPAQVQTTDAKCSDPQYTTQATCVANNETWSQRGPLSNPTWGPYFKRKSDNPTNVKAPLAGNTLNDEWENLGSRVFKFGTAYGVGLYSDPNSVEYILVATSTGVYAAREGMLAFKLAGLEDAGGPVTFVQAFNQVVMFRGEEKSPYLMKNLTAGFTAIVQEDNTEEFEENDQGDGTQIIPNASNAIYFQNRLLIPHTRDLVSASDFLNITRYLPVLSSFRINQGSADSLVALHKFDSTTIICFKEASIYMVRNVYGNLTDLVLDEMSSAYGCAAAKSIVSVGRDVWFLSDKRGVCSLGITESGAVQGVDQPISEPIQPLIDRINWHNAHLAVSAYANNRFYIAVPLDSGLDPDGNKSNTAVLIFDFLNQFWAGYDDGIYVKEWVEPIVWGRKRLCFLGYDGTINLYDDIELGGIEDETVDSAGVRSTTPITDELVTRGYNLGTPDRKKWHAARVNVQTLASTFTASAQVDGVEEQTVISTVTTDPTKYDKPFYQADYVATNVNDDFNVPYRQDYSISLSGDANAAAGQLWLSKQVGGSWTDGEGATPTVLINPDFHQESSHKLRLREEGRYTQVKIESSQGSTRLASVLVDGLPRNQYLRKET